VILSCEKRNSDCAFTVIELLIVMSIIIVLAGLVLMTSGYVQKKGARSRAEAEVAAMSAALESYKADNGIYPTTTDTESLDPRTSTDLTAYQAASVALYNALVGATAGERTPPPGAKSYFAFKPNMLNPPPPSTAVVTSIRDPFGNSYGYSTLKAKTPAATGGYNPTFDLWSTGGVTPPAPADQSQWIKNW
jgi:general secretion pathway protein G